MQWLIMLRLNEEIQENVAFSKMPGILLMCPENNFFFCDFCTQDLKHSRKD